MHSPALCVSCKRGRNRSTHHTHIPPIVLPPPYTLLTHNLHTQEKGAPREFITRSKILIKFVEVDMCVYTPPIFPSPLSISLATPPPPRINFFGRFAKLWVFTVLTQFLHITDLNLKFRGRLEYQQEYLEYQRGARYLVIPSPKCNK